MVRTATPPGCGAGEPGRVTECARAAAGKHVVFGKVVKGMDVVVTVEAVGSQGGETSKKVVIKGCGELAASDPAFLDKD